jgi:hypothetical protein
MIDTTHAIIYAMYMPPKRRKKTAPNGLKFDDEYF